eukprot:759472-Prymnesium_polylepis.1
MACPHASRECWFDSTRLFTCAVLMLTILSLRWCLRVSFCPHAIELLRLLVHTSAVGRTKVAGGGM